MEDRKLSTSPEIITEPDHNDIFMVLDVSDPSDGPGGTNKKSLWSTLKRGTIRSEVGTTYTTDNSDNGKIITLNNSSPVTMTIHQTALSGFNLLIIQKGAGKVTVAAGGSGAIRHRMSHTKLVGQYSMATIFVESNAGNAPQVYLQGDTSL
jgi:hypothetical protein